MKYLTLPIHLIEFWYPESLIFFVRTWKNLMLFLEEDLAVTLMWKLLFAPLFHDQSYVGRILSFIFRISRILIGLFAFSLISIIVFTVAVYWFLLSILIVLDLPQYVSRGLFLASLGLFVIHITTHPHRKVWSIKESSLSFGQDIWDASVLRKEKISLAALLKKWEIIDFLANLELELDHLPYYEIKDVETIGKKAFELARQSVSQYIGPRHFFVAILLNIPEIDNILLKLDLKVSDLTECLNYLEEKKNTWRKVYFWDEDFTIRHLKGVNRGWLGVPTPELDKYSEDWTNKAADIGFPELIRENGVDKEVINILSQQTGRNVILVGPPGSGKTALIRHLAQQIVSGNAPESMATKRLVVLDLTKLLSGITTQGDLAERIKNIFEEVEFAQNIIIVIEEIHELGMGEVGSELNLYSLMQPYLEKDLFQFIGTDEQENYSRILEKNSSFARIFRKVEIVPATIDDTLNILEYRSIEAEKDSNKHGAKKIKVSFIALKTAVELSQKFVKDRCLPDSAIQVLKEGLTESVKGWVTKDVIKSVISEWVKVPRMEVDAKDKDRLLGLENELHARIIGQEQAVSAIANSLRRSATGLNEAGRPISSFLFVGPTGVGKTELAKALADIYFKTSGAFIRFDMSEYQNPESIARLIGDAGEGGLLTESVRNRPYALLLLDEFEKANDKILTLFLQVLDDGRLTDGTGKTISFENTIIIATSNVGSVLIAEGIQDGRSLDIIDKQVSSELLKVFKPELVNRFDDVVLFKPLSSVELQKIVKMKLDILQSQMKVKGYLLEFDPNLLEQLAKYGFDPVMGARPLRRLIQDTLESNLSKLILENKLIKATPFIATAQLLQP